ncbi:SDR family oxidoreductase [Pseudolysinimonas sp.]|uniref:SDR family oxidoreductase n=1 Tax=Pseudolysinimonas sp. TaxID=2680009 RepID=UPI003F7FBB16
MRASGNTILVAGGTSGIGLGLALRWRDAGNVVVVAGRRDDLRAAIEAEHGLATLPLDVADPASIDELAARVARDHPDVDALVCMAGIMLAEDLTDPGHLDIAERTVEVNLLGTIRLVHAMLPQLLARESSAIMTVSSGLAFVPLPVTPTYNATKAAIHSYTQSLRVQLAGRGVEVVELVPPGVRTTLFGQEEAGSGMPLDEFLDEVMQLLAVEPPLEEICVEDVGYFRYAEARGQHAEVLRVLSGA